MQGKFLNSCAVATDPESTAGSYRLPYPTTPPPHHSSRGRMFNTHSHTVTDRDKGHETKTQQGHVRDVNATNQRVALVDEDSDLQS